MFIIDNGEFTIDPQYLTIIAFRDVWERDTTPKKKVATGQLGWLYHMYHPKSTYRDMLQARRPSAIIMNCLPKEYWDWDPETDDVFRPAEIWYKDKLSDTPIWDSVRSLEQAVYHFNLILRDQDASASDKRIAIEQVADVLQPKLRKLREQAERDEIIDIKIKADKKIKAGEKRENADRGRKAIPGVVYRGMAPDDFDHEAALSNPEPHIE